MNGIVEFEVIPEVWDDCSSVQRKWEGRRESVLTGLVLKEELKQGSVLSPVLFLIVMDPLLKHLQESCLGLSDNNFYAGGFLHADDIRSVAIPNVSLERQTALMIGICLCKLPEVECSEM